MTRLAHVAPITRRSVVDRAYTFAMDRVTRAFEDSDGQRIIEGIATTPTVDRSGDSINPQGMTFTLPLPLLWQHNPDFPIGNVVAATVTPQGIHFRAVIAGAETLSAIDNHWRELQAGLVRFLSVGFRAKSPPKVTKTGLHYDQTEWLELSCVTIPANPDCAITTIKAFEIGADVAPDSDGEPAANAPRTRTTAMTIKEKIAARKARLVELRAQVSQLAESEFTAEVQRDLDATNAEIESEQAELTMLERTQANIAEDAQPAGGTSIVTRTPASIVQPRAPSILHAPRALDKPRAKACMLFRSCAAHAVAYAHNVPVEVAAQHLFRDDEVLKGYMMVQKAAVEPALTTVPEWAGSLVRETWAEFLDLLAPVSVYAALAAKGSSFSFDQFGKVIYPSRNKTPNLAGDFVGENAPIPVKKASIASAALTPKKLAVISAFSQEMSTASGGRIESYIRDFMIEDTAVLLDTKLLDNAAATAIRPAGLLNGVTLTPSSGATFADIITDIKAAMGPLLAVGGGRSLVWLMNPMQAMSIGLQTNAAGAFVWGDPRSGWNGASVIVSANVPDGTMILVDAADFITAANDTPQFRVSAEATLHMEDTTPLPINGGTPAAPVISLYQQDSFAVRMIQQMNWAMRRPGMVSGISGITW